MLKKMSMNANLLSVASAGALALMSVSAHAEEWRGWNIHPEGYPNTEALESFADKVAERTEGRIEPKMYNNGVLGDQPDAIEQARSGALAFGNFNMGPMGPIVNETNVLSLPFLFSSREHMHDVMDGDIGRRFADALEEKNLVALSWFDSGARSLYNTDRPVEEPSDVEGLKIRVMNNDLYVDMIEALDGNATPMAYGEVYQSLKTGVIDGAENNFPSFESSNHYEVSKYYSLTEHLIIPECICIAKSKWDSLSDEDQDIVREEALAAAELQRELWTEGSEESRQIVEDDGVEINEVKDKSAFQEKMQPVYDQFLEENPDLESLVSDIQDTI
ncbi:TRAP transporter substrate-binding protein [Aidingimonas halophila]|uniref:Tripartite ATP-independent transporter solute receptor, DctP family n=1 Tax=Aidingimonas halophila TaxID=574349 RepID=A0A1H3F3Z3_9GAMM|nr:TRAP transporter substrate-binding protein [Aidingimonas halophila]GHC32303.1 C4-dicarboxylate ABC transporter [Aidingimonas halophila]SDX85567.1 tripartite ATP-independent transporter solute receptor, DctP family [Aidingimonas halophila]